MILLPVLFHLSASLCSRSLGTHFLSCSYFNSKCYKPVGSQFPQNIFRTRLREVTPWAAQGQDSICVSLKRPASPIHANPPGKDRVTSHSTILSSLCHRRGEPSPSTAVMSHHHGTTIAWCNTEAVTDIK